MIAAFLCGQVCATHTQFHQSPPLNLLQPTSDAQVTHPQVIPRHGFPPDQGLRQATTHHIRSSPQKSHHRRHNHLSRGNSTLHMVAGTTSTQGTRSIHASTIEGLCVTGNPRKRDHPLHPAVRYSKSADYPAAGSLLSSTSIGTCSFGRREDKM